MKAEFSIKLILYIAPNFPAPNCPGTFTTLSAFFRPLCRIPFLCTYYVYLSYYLSFSILLRLSVILPSFLCSCLPISISIFVSLSLSILSVVLPPFLCPSLPVYSIASLSLFLYFCRFASVPLVCLGFSLPLSLFLYLHFSVLLRLSVDPPLCRSASLLVLWKSDLSFS